MKSSCYTTISCSFDQIFNASHMAPYDYPNIAHDMILRFMGVNFSAVVDGSARIPSSVGNDHKPVFSESDGASNVGQPSGKTPEQDKAMWEGTVAFLSSFLIHC
jgi:carboxypeptidase D